MFSTINVINKRTEYIRGSYYVLSWAIIIVHRLSKASAFTAPYRFSNVCVFTTKQLYIYTFNLVIRMWPWDSNALRILVLFVPVYEILEITNIVRATKYVNMPSESLTTGWQQ